MRKPTEVPFPGKVWLKRYLDESKWHSVREDQVIWDIKKYFPYDWEHQLFIAKKGLMGIQTPYTRYIWLVDSAYQDELPF